MPEQKEAPCQFRCYYLYTTMNSIKKGDCILLIFESPIAPNRAICTSINAKDIVEMDTRKDSYI